MPHVLIKRLPGKSEEQKTQLAEAIAKDVISVMHYGEEAISVAFEEIDLQDWTEKVFLPDIHSRWDQVYKKPGYNPF